METYLENRFAINRMAARQSVRSFSEKAIPEEILREILSLGIHGATGGNLQPYSVIIERDKERSHRLSEMLGFSFVKDAAVNLLFVIDWNKLAIYSKCRNAPFTHNRSMNHFFIAWEDAVICAQNIETAAWLHGIGSCYVGNAMLCTAELTEMYKLPYMTYPVVLLSMGYPKTLPKPRKKLEYEMMVFEGSYPDLSKEEICRAFDKKYEGLGYQIPREPEAKKRFLDKFRKALETTYTKEECENIISEAEEAGSINEIQRVFGIHYHAVDVIGDKIIDDLRMKNMDILS